MARILAFGLGLLLLAACGGAGAGNRSQWTAEQVIAGFKAAGLEAESPQLMTPKDYGMAPLLGKGTRFLIPSMCADCGGRVFIGTPEEIEKLRAFYAEVAKASALFYSHVYQRDNVLVQINGDLPPEKAAQYEAALKALK